MDLDGIAYLATADFVEGVKTKMTKTKKSDIWAKAMVYWGKHPHYTAFVHVAGGLGAGLIFAPMLGDVAITLGVVLIVVSLLGHAYAILGE